MSHLRTSLGLVAAAACFAAPAAAGAAVVTGTPNNGDVSVRYDPTDGVASTLTLTGTRAAVTITDPVGVMTTAGTGCVAAPGGKSVTCTPPANGEVTGVDVDAGDLADSITSQVTGFTVPIPGGIVLGAAQIDLDGGSGADTITGGPSDERLDGGGGGADALDGGVGNDGLVGADTGSTIATGGPGDDTAFVGEAPFTVDGGAGSDGLLNFPNSLISDGMGGFKGQTLRLDASAATTGNGYPGQTLSLAGIENLYGGPGDDTLTGSAASNVLIGFGGKDTIDGGPGFDTLYGGSASDYASLIINQELSVADAANTMRAVDGGGDSVDCGAAGSTVAADAVDGLFNCPAVGAGTTLTPLPAPAPVVQIVDRPVAAAPDKTKPTLRGFKAAKRVKGKALRKTGRYSVTFTPSEAVAGVVQLTAKAKRLASIAAAGDVVLATRSTGKATATKRTVRLTVPKRYRKLLRKGRKLTLSVAVTDKGGNTTTKRQAVRVG